eukprot:11175820-Lingulodinium_polyedra.AAC.1
MACLGLPKHNGLSLGQPTISVANDVVYFTGESDADADANASDDSGRESLDLSAVSPLPDAQ